MQNHGARFAAALCGGLIALASTAGAGRAQDMSEDYPDPPAPASPAPLPHATPAPPPSSTGAQTRSAASRHAASSRPASATGVPTTADPYRCHPSEDIACTVVRETRQGTLIVTMRPPGVAARPATWSVIAGPPPGQFDAAGGTVYVVPAVQITSERRTAVIDLAASPPNGAPIID